MSPPTNQHLVFFYRPDALPVARPTVSKQLFLDLSSIGFVLSLFSSHFFPFNHFNLHSFIMVYCLRLKVCFAIYKYQVNLMCDINEFDIAIFDQTI